MRYLAVLCLGLWAVPSWAAEPVPLSVASMDHPHIWSIQDGTVGIPECRISYSTLSAADLIRRFDEGSAGDVIEVDIMSYLARFSKEETHDWVLIPVFLWREFPHHHLLVPAKDPAKIIVDHPNPSLAVWARGILGGARDIAFSTVSAGHPFFPDPKAVEQAYFRETRIFPVITVLALRRELNKANPWLPEALFLAFSEAKRRALEAGTIPLPWGPEHREETVALMQKNYWSYGIRNNPKTLGALFAHARDQGIIGKNLKPDDVFAPETLQLIDEKGAKN